MDRVTVEGIYQNQTDKAVCIEVDGDDYWIPKSLIEAGPDFDECARGEEVEIEVPEWFAEQEGLV